MPTPGHFRSDRARGHFLEVYRVAMATMPAPADTHDLPTSFGTVRAYRFDGPAGRPVVLLPGRNASTPMWADNLPALLAHRTVYCVDLLGEPGLSVPTEAVANAADQAQWLDETLTGLHLSTPHLVGVSFGGWVATNLAVHQPNRVASLTLLDPVMTFAPIPILTMIAVAPVGIPGIPESYRRRVLRWISGGAEVDDAVPMAALIAAGVADFEVRQPFPSRFTEEQLRALDIPVLALIAGRSVIHAAERAAGRARRLLPRARVEVWRDASHAITGEHPGRIAARASRFWDDVDASGRPR